MRNDGPSTRSLRSLAVRPPACRQAGAHHPSRTVLSKVEGLRTMVSRSTLLTVLRTMLSSVEAQVPPLATASNHGRVYFAEKLSCFSFVGHVPCLLKFLRSSHVKTFERSRMVGVVRFELTTFCSQSRRAKPTALHPGLARPGRIERPTPYLEGMCSIQLSYGRTNIWLYPA